MTSRTYLSAVELRGAVIQAAKPIKDRFRQQMTKTLKGDGSPVTDVDMAVHDSLLAWSLEEDFGFISEEGNDKVDNDYILYVDPLDGTASYSAGIPTVTVAASIMKRVNGQYYRPAISVIYEPLTGWSWMALEDGRTLVDDFNYREQTYVDTDAEQQLVTSIFPPGPHRYLRGIRDLINAQQPRMKHQASGSLALCGGLIASGKTHGLIFGGTSAAEVCAMMPIVNGAGGVVTSLSASKLDAFKLGVNKGKVDFILPNGAILTNSTRLTAKLAAMTHEVQEAVL